MSTTALKFDPATWPRAARSPKDPKPPGGFTPGSPYLGGPTYTDAFSSRRAPTPWQLIEKYRALVYAMVAKNANSVVRIPLRLYKDGSRGQGGPPSRHADPIRVSRAVGKRLAREGRISTAAVDKVYEVRTHPILQLIEKPDPYGYFTKDLLISLLVRYCDVVGSAYLFPDWDGWNLKTGQAPNRVPDFLWVLYSQYVLPIRMAGSPLLNLFQYFSQGLPFENVLWFRQTVSLRDPYGGTYSPTYAGIQYSDQEEKQIAIYDQVLGLGPRPNVLVSATDPMMPLGEDQAKRLEQDMIRRHAAGYAGGVMVVRDPVTVTPLSYSPADLAGKEISEYDRCNLAAIFGQPATYYTTDTNLANLEAADQQHARNGVDPRCKMVAAGLTALVQRYDPTLFFAFDESLPEDEELKVKLLDMQLKNGSITINQANEETQWPPVEWGNEPWIPGTLVQPSMAKAQQEQALASQKMADENAKKATDFQYSDSPDGSADDNYVDQSEYEERSISRRIDEWLTRIEIDMGLVRAKDSSGHEHVGKGDPKGGQFTGSGGGGGGSANEETHGRKPRAPHKPGEAKSSKSEDKASGPRDLGDSDEEKIAAHHEMMGKGIYDETDGETKAALEHYTGSEYARFNEILRDPNTDPEDIERDTLINSIDTLIDQSELEEDTIVYRGVSDIEDLGLEEDEIVGSSVRDPAWVSTSLSRDVANNFAGNLIRIMAPKGTKGASMFGFSRCPSEYEVLFARNSTLRFTGIGKIGSQKVYEATIIQENE